MADAIGALKVVLAMDSAQFDAGVDKATGKMKGLGSEGTKMSSMLKGAFAGLGIAAITAAANEAGKLADVWSDLNSRLKGATGSTEAGAAAMSRLEKVARETYSSIEQTTESYLKNASSLKELGYGLQTQLDLTETLNNALVISATRGQKAASVQDAWSKAMAVGKLSSEGLNTILAGSDRLALALAESMGIGKNQLQEYAAAGKITTEAMIGVTSQMDMLRAEAADMPATISDGFTLMGNSILSVVGKLDQATGASGSFAEALIGLADAVSAFPETKFFDIMVEFFEEGGKVVEGTAKEVELLGQGFAWLGNQIFGARAELIFLTDEARLDLLAADAENMWAAVGAAFDEILALDSLSTSEVRLEIIGLKEGLEAGTMSAEDAFEAIMLLGEVDPDFGAVSGKLAGLIGGLHGIIKTAAAAGQAVKDAFNATLGQDTDLGGDLSYSDYMFDMGFYKNQEAEVNPPARPLGWGSIDLDAEKKANGGGGKGKRKSPMEELQKQLKDLQQSLKTTEELQIESFEKQQETLIAALEKKLITQQEYDELTKEAKQKHTDEMAEITKAGLEKENEYREQMMDHAASIFGSMSSLFASFGDENLAISKAFAVAEAVVNTAQGITKALAQGGMLGFAGAAAVAASGAAQIATILSASKGKSSSPSVRASSGAASATQSTPIAGNSGNITFQFLGSAKYSQEEVMNMASGLGNFLANGGTISGINVESAA